MHKILAGVAGALLLLAAVVAAADEIAGEIAEISMQTRTIVVVAPGECICQGTPYVLAGDININTLSVGLQVKLTYTVAGNVRTVSKVSR